MILDTGRIFLVGISVEDLAIWAEVIGRGCKCDEFGAFSWAKCFGIRLHELSKRSDQYDASLMFCLVDSSRDRALKNG